LLFIVLMPTQAIATQLAADHIKCEKLGLGLPAQGEPAELKRAWLEWRNQHVEIPGGHAADGLTLVGLRRCVTSEGNMAHVVYTRQGRPLSLFIFAKGRPGSGAVEALGHKAILWQSGSLTYALVGRSEGLQHTAMWMQEQVRLKTED
nr:hypothetical protein [Acidobacteriota bacterium]